MTEKKHRKQNIIVYALILTPVIILMTAGVLRLHIFSPLTKPVFSVASGIYDEDFELEIKSDRPGTKIYYTIDGSLPNPKDTENTYIYDGPIKITDVSDRPNVISGRSDLSLRDYHIPDVDEVPKGTVIRAVCCDNSGISEVNFASYFVFSDEDIRECFKDMGVLSLVCDPKDLLDEASGIMVKGDIFEKFKVENPELADVKYDFFAQTNFTQRGKEWERDCQIAFIRPDKESFTQDFGIRNRGIAGSDGPKKAYNFYARDEKGRSSYVNQNPFIGLDEVFEDDEKYEGRSLHKYRGLMIKNQQCLIRDGFITSIVDNSNLPAVDYAPVNVFINGEYWGLYCLMERYDTNFFANHFGVKPEDVAIVKSGESESATPEEMQELMNLIRPGDDVDYSLENNYAYINSKIDLDTFIDYYCVQIFVDNLDYDDTYNCLMWKTRNLDSNNEYNDGRWRWVLYDIDACLISHTQDNVNFNLMEGRTSPTEHPLFKALMANSDFREKFIERMNYYTYDVFASEEMEDRINHFRHIYKESASLSNKRFGFDGDFGDELRDMVIFYNERANYLSKFINQYMELHGYPERMN